MSQRVDIPFNGPAFESSSAFMSYQICRNFYLRPWPEGGENKWALFGTPGTVEWADTLIPAEVRGALVYGELLYVVVGTQLLSYNTSTVKTVLGTLNTSSGPVGMATNGLDLAIVDGSEGWVWDYTATTFAQIVDADFPACKDIIQMDGYYLVAKVGTGQIWRSDYNTGVDWGGLAFSTAGADPDNIIALSASNRDIFTIGEETTEIWVNTGQDTFNFTSVTGATIQKGGTSAFARTYINNATYWVARDKHGQGQLIECIGRVPKVVSTSAITNVIQGWGNLADLQMWAYEQLDHNFVIITSPSAEETLVYDSTTKQWHSRSSKRFGANNRWKTNCHAFFGNKHLVGDYYNGKIYELSPDIYDEDGEEILSVRRTSVYRKTQNRATLNEVQVVAETGVGLITGDPQDIDPHMNLRYSKDGGRTWRSNNDLRLGKIGETEVRSRATQFGQGRNWVLELRISARVKRVILGAVAEFEIDD